MDKNSSHKIIKDTLENPFDKDRFLVFTKNLLNRIDESKAFHARGYVPEVFKDYVKTYERLGTYMDPEGKKIDVLIVYLQKESSLERARTAQRNFVARYLKDRDQKDGGLVAFVSPNPEDWRFSFVKMDYKFAEGTNGKVKVKEEFTPARRWSFLVGANESSHTAKSRLAPVVQEDEFNPTLMVLEDAFNIEKVTEEFFEKYRDLFLRVRETLDELVKKDSTLRKDFAEKGVNTVDFSKKLLGQIVFLYFLQKKGWFGVERDGRWGSGPKNFLRQLFDKKHGGYKNFFNDILEPLFYEALRIDRSHDDNYYSRFNCKIPFLNGGLFDPINNYDWVHTDILLPNELFSNNRPTKEGDIGDGILDVFDRYNFTVKEDEPLEKEVAVDPEMLGKVFENLLEVKDRKSKGTYYTPREIVHYMCVQSLVNYLVTELEGKVGKEDLEKLIKYGDTVGENEARVEEKGEETQRYYYKLPETIRVHAKLIDEELANIKVCDPAIGSGAFPVGMMTEIVRTRTTLSSYIKDPSRTLYNFKRDCIQNSLYGVDIDPGAVEIAKLRLWLSLVVDEDDIEQIKPLPNLDYKIVCGDSLTDVEKNLFNQDLFDQLEKLKPFFFSEINPKKKFEFRKKIDELIEQVTSNNQNFDFEVYFSEVYHEKGGFDVVIANPPYVSYGLRGGQKMTTRAKEFLKTKYPNSAEYKISLYAVFMEKAIRICKQDGGLQTFIVPDSFLLGRYFSKIRDYILTNNEVISLLLLPYSVFDATVGFSVVYLFQKKQRVESDNKITARFSETNEAVQEGTFKSFSYKQGYFRGLKHNRFRLFFDQQSMDLISKIEKDTTELGSIVKFSSGLIGKNGQDSIISKTKNGAKWLPGIVSGGEINKYAIFPDGNYLLYDKAKIKSGYESVDYFNEKLFMRQTGDSLICAYDKDDLLTLNNVHIGNLINGNYSLKFITSIINSRLLNCYYKSISLETGRVMAQTDIETVEGLPIRKLTMTEQKPFIEIVDRILSLTKSQGYRNSSSKQAEAQDCMRRLDKMIYKLYDLSSAEIEVIKNSGSK